MGVGAVDLEPNGAPVAMTRKPDPTRIYEAKREGLRGRMVASWHVPEATGDQLAPLGTGVIHVTAAKAFRDIPAPPATDTQ